MRKKGSITVFLVLILVLLFSLVLTTLEAARIAGGKAYVQMLSVMAGDSARALYYYPLFKEYGLLGINASDDAGYFSEQKLEKTVKEDVTFALTGLKGGLLSFSEPSVEVTETRTLLSDEAESFLKQIKELAVLEGMQDVLSRLVLEQEFNDAVYASQIYQKQEEAIAQTATVTQEILKLMELVDGVITEEEGLCFDAEGKLKTTDVFIKRLCTFTEEEWEENYENEEIYQAVKGNFWSPKDHAEELYRLLRKGAEMQAELAVFDLELREYKERRGEIAEELSAELSEEKADALFEEAKVLAERIESVTGQRDELIEWLDIACMDMEEQYETLKKELEQVMPLLSQAKEILTELESKQLGAQLSVKLYENYLSELKDEVSTELYAVFQEELQRLKLYAGLSDAGYQVSEMRESIEKNERLLEETALPEFSGETLYEMSLCVRAVAERMEEYTAEGLWFTYGTMTAVPTVQGSVFRMMEKIATGSILSFVGLSEKELSEKRIGGQNLPSAGLLAEKTQTQIFRCFDEIVELLRSEGFLGVLKAGAEQSADLLALEWYAENYFGSFANVLEGRRLSYEREYLLFGNKTDKGNLLSTALYLIAIRSVFAMVSILKDAGKMSQLDLFAVGAVGFTGIPVLISAVKYGMLLLWAVEEAVVEVAVLFDGKRVPLFSVEGQISFSELFLFGKELVEVKAKTWKDAPDGFSYGEYLTVLSLLKSTQRKAYRSLDLIQENLRYRYRADFSIKNVVTEFSFRIQSQLEQKINTGLWKEEIYEISIQEAVAF